MYKFGAFLCLLGLADIHGVADVRQPTVEELSCIEAAPSIEIKPPVNKWLQVDYGPAGQIIMFRLEKGSHMVSRNGIAPFNLFAEMDIGVRGRLLKEHGCIEVRFQSIEGVEMEGEDAVQMKQLFNSIFPSFVPEGETSVYMLQTVGYDADQVSNLFFLNEDNVPKRAVLQQQSRNSTTAWELVEGDEFSRRLKERLAVPQVQN